MRPKSHQIHNHKKINWKYPFLCSFCASVLLDVLQHKAVNTDFAYIIFACRRSRSKFSSFIVAHVTLWFHDVAVDHFRSLLFWRAFVSATFWLSGFWAFRIVIVSFIYIFCYFIILNIFFFCFLFFYVRQKLKPKKIEPQETDSMWRRKEKFIGEGKPFFFLSVLFLLVFAWFYVSNFMFAFWFHLHDTIVYVTRRFVIIA